MPELDPRPIYEPPEVLRLTEIQQGTGQSLCAAGSTPGQDCETGSGADGFCNSGGAAIVSACAPGTGGI